MKPFLPEQEKATDVAKYLIKEVSPRFELPRSSRSDDGPSSVDNIIQQLAQVLEIDYHAHHRDLNPWLR